MNNRKITEKVSYIGVNDRKTALFESNWPVPHGVSYNSYIIKDKSNVLIDTVEYGSDGEFLEKVEEVLGGEPLNYLVVNHMEPDHSGMIRSVMEKYPGLKIIGNEQTYKLLSLYYGVPRERFLSIKDGEEMSIGSTTLKFIYIPWVHWPETMVTYIKEEGLLFTCDAFGGYGTLDGGLFDGDYNIEETFIPEMRRYYSNIVARWSLMVGKAITKLSDLPIKMIAPSHGLIWRENPGRVMQLYSDWASFKGEQGAVIAYASMYGNTARLADDIGSALSEAGIKNIHTYDVSKTNVSYIISDIQRFKGFILGSCAYNGFMHPAMENLCNEISIMQPKNRVVGVFGTGGWNGAGAKKLTEWANNAKLNLITPTIDILGAPTAEKVQDGITELAKNFGDAIKG